MSKFIILTGLVSIFLVSCGQNTSINQVNSKDFNELIKDNNAILLDVRTMHEYKNGHIKDAGQLNFYALDFNKKILLLPKNQPIYLYCNTGYRSNKVAGFLIENGYNQVYNLQYGIMEWYLNNFPVIEDPDACPDLDNKFNIEQYETLINSDSLVFIDFYAPWCAPCRKMMPMIDSIKLEYYNDINIVKINIDASKKLIKRLEIIGVPYFLFYYKGELLFSKSGRIKKTELKKIFELQIEKQDVKENK